MPERMPPEVLEYLRSMGKKYGSQGGKRSLETMTAEERSARAKEGLASRSEETDGGPSGKGTRQEDGEEVRYKANCVRNYRCKCGGSFREGAWLVRVNLLRTKPDGEAEE